MKEGDELVKTSEEFKIAWNSWRANKPRGLEMVL